MLPKINPTETESWKQLQQHFEEMKNVHMKDMFTEDPARFQKYSLQYRKSFVTFPKI